MRNKCGWEDCFTCPYPDCILDIDSITFRKESKETISKRVAKKSMLRIERAGQGLCTECGQRPPRSGYKMCHKCQSKARAYKENEERRNGRLSRSMMDGINLCAKCGKMAPMDGYHVCKRCYESNMAHLALTPTHKGKKPQNGFAAAHEVFWRRMTAKPTAEVTIATG